MWPEIMKIPASPTVSPWSLLRNGGNLSAFLRRKEVKFCAFFGYARIALREALRILGFEKENSILMPSYICDVVLPPVSELGVKAEFYRVSLDLCPNVLDIKARISKRTKAILVVNYFGFPQDISVKKVAEENDLYVIEDNAHSFLSEKNSRLLGTFGDVGIATLRKTLPVPDGAVLFVNNDTLLGKARVSSEDITARASVWPFIFIGYHLMPFSIIRYKLPLNISEKTHYLFNSKDHSSAEEDYEKCKVQMSQISLKIANNLDFNEVKQKRRENYKTWLEKVNGKRELRVIFKSLPEGVVPQAFPVIVKRPKNFIEKMTNKGIPVSTWPSLPKEIKSNSEYFNANFLTKHLVTLPVHQGIKKRLIEDLEIVF